MKHESDISPLSMLLARADAISEGAIPADTIPSGYPSLDRLVGGGLRRGDLAVLGGDVGSGKSALAQAIAMRAAAAGHVVGLFSGEGSRERVLERALVIEGRARLDELRSGRLDELGRARAGAAAVRLRDVMPRVETITSHGVAGIRAELGESWRPELVIVDSLQSLVMERPLAEGLAAATLELKRLAVEADVSILLTAQLPALAARPDRRPNLDDFGAMGAVKHHADVVLGIFREEMYDPARGNEGATELLLLKNRSGCTGYVDLYFYAHCMRFEDMLDPDR